MSVSVLFGAGAKAWADYKARLPAAFSEAGLDVRLSCDLPPDEVDYIIYAPDSPLQDFGPFVRLKAVLNLWAGVETVVQNPTLTMPLCRMVDPALTQGMVEWVTGHVLRHHLGMDAHIRGTAGEWAPVTPPVAWDRPVTVLGFGALGRACAAALAGLGFPVTGWSRRPHRMDGVRCLSGPVADALRDAQIVVLLLPDTPATRNILDAAALSALAPGAVVVNPGRGPLIDDAALLDALASGQVGHATLDVFRTEPLPADDPYWRHPRVTVTPHIASVTRPEWSARTLAETIRLNEAGEGLRHVVDRSVGY